MKFGICIHEGGVGTGFKNASEEDKADKYDTDGTRLFHIRGTNDFNTRAVQVKEVAASLSAGDCYILETPEQLYCWYGRGCSGDEREFMRKIRSSPGMSFQSKNTDPENITEGSEPPEFWAALGSNPEEGPNAYSKAIFEDEPERPPRLFQCSDARGYFWAEEIFDFDQADLIEEDVMLLDTWREVFVWVGKDAKDNERKEALELARKYVVDGADVTGRSEDDVSFQVIKQGLEPVNFTCHFMGWSDDKWRNGMTYEEMKAQLAATNPAEAEAMAAPASLDSELAKVTVGATKYDYDTLMNAQEGEIDGLDLTQKEAYLSDEEFEKIFGMDRQAFNGMAKWKQLKKKKEVKLF